MDVKITCEYCNREIHMILDSADENITIAGNDRGRFVFTCPHCGESFDVAVSSDFRFIANIEDLITSTNPNYTSSPIMYYFNRHLIQSKYTNQCYSTVGLMALVGLLDFIFFYFYKLAQFPQNNILIWIAVIVSLILIFIIGFNYLSIWSDKTFSKYIDKILINKYADDNDLINLIEQLTKYTDLCKKYKIVPEKKSDIEYVLKNANKEMDRRGKKLS